jgi:hypothetical protein
VKANDTGSVMLGAAEAVAAPAPVLPTASALTVGAPTGERLSVYLTFDPNALLDRWELPPVGPAGSFDVRFSTGRLVETLDPTSPALRRIEVRSPHATLLLWAEAPMEGSCDGRSWERLPMTIPGNGSVLVREAGANGSPATFTLEQNFPNPFNPSTAIRYRLGERSVIRMTLVAASGQTVAVLADEAQEAGTHTVALDARRLRLSSGVYWYRMTGTGLDTGRRFDATRTLVLLQ